ncbi:ribosome-inactivating family protein [Streptomyces geranii]|uniref:ribosome-inactivating family protein n=1 Tax=Streptomyces geranii TaxID=2058923 RepID=UPI000D040927|nr:ribosome-inactivating family protein [Streptomyces geranii]
MWRLSAPDAPVFRHPLHGQVLHDGIVWDPGRPVLRYLEGSTVHSLDLGPVLTAPWNSHPLNEALLSPDSRTFATAERSATGYRFQLRDTRDGHLLRTLPSSPLPVSMDPADPVVARDTTPLMSFSPDSTAFTHGLSAAGFEASPQRFVVWDMSRDRERTALHLARESLSQVLSVVLGPDGRTLVASRTRGIGHQRGEMWNTGSRSRTAVLEGLGSVHLAVRPDGRLLAGDVDFTDLASGRVTRRTLSRGEQINALAFSPDGSRMAAGDTTGRVALWDRTLRHRTGVLPNLFPAALGHTSEAVSALAFSPDGNILAVAGAAGTLQLWDTATEQPVGGNLATSGEPIHFLAFGPDSTTLYVSGDHAPLQRYSVTPAHAIAPDTPTGDPSNQKNPAGRTERIGFLGKSRQNRMAIGMKVFPGTRLGSMALISTDAADAVFVSGVSTESLGSVHGARTATVWLDQSTAQSVAYGTPSLSASDPYDNRGNPSQQMTFDYFGFINAIRSRVHDYNNVVEGTSDTAEHTSGNNWQDFFYVDVANSRGRTVSLQLNAGNLYFVGWFTGTGDVYN